MGEHQQNEPALSKPKQFEKDWDEGIDLLKRRPWIGVIFLLFILVPGGYCVWKIESQKEQILDLNTQLDRTTADRNAKEAQLAPFEAVAAKAYQSSPTNEQLTLLAQQVSKLGDSIDGIRAQVGLKSHLSTKTKKIIADKLPECQPYKISIWFETGDGDGAAFCNEIDAALKPSGFCRGISEAIKFGITGKIVISSGTKIISGPMAEILNAIATDSQREFLGQYNEHYETNVIVIEVGTKL